MFTGILSPELSTYPSNLKDIYDKEWIVGGSNLREIFKAFEVKKKIFLQKLNENFNFLTYIIGLPDHISHLNYLKLDKILHYIDLSYIKIDKFFKEILKTKNYDNIFIISDHGLTIYKKVFYFYSWIKKKRLFQFPPDREREKWYSILLKLYDIFRPILEPTNQLKKFYHYLFLYKGKKEIQNKINKSKSGIPFKKIKPRASLVIPGVFRFQSFKSNLGGLYLENRYKFLKKKIKEELLKDKNVFKIISPKNEFFPDFYILLKNKYYFSADPSIYNTRNTNVISHSLDGIFIAYGNNIKNGKGDKVCYIDIAPTILKLFGIEKLKWMTGKALNIFNS